MFSAGALAELLVRSLLLAVFSVLASLRPCAGSRLQLELAFFLSTDRLLLVALLLHLLVAYDGLICLPLFVNNLFDFSNDDESSLLRLRIFEFDFLRARVGLWWPALLIVFERFVRISSSTFFVPVWVLFQTICSDFPPTSWRFTGFTNARPVDQTGRILRAYL